MNKSAQQSVIMTTGESKPDFSRLRYLSKPVSSPSNQLTSPQQFNTPLLHLVTTTHMFSITPGAHIPRHGGAAEPALARQHGLEVPVAIGDEQGATVGRQLGGVPRLERGEYSRERLRVVHRLLRHGTAWHGTARVITPPARHGTARHGMARHARHGTARVILKSVWYDIMGRVILSSVRQGGTIPTPALQIRVIPMSPLQIQVIPMLLLQVRIIPISARQRLDKTHHQNEGRLKN